MTDKLSHNRMDYDRKRVYENVLRLSWGKQPGQF